MDMSELEKDNLILDLVRSRSYSDTHGLIGRLSNFTDFTDSQVSSLVFAATFNPQVHQIIGDTEIFDFYTNLISGREAAVGDDKLLKLQRILSGRRPPWLPRPPSHGDDYDDQLDW